MHPKSIITKGKELSATGKVLILIHGRGSSAENILGLGEQLHVKDFALIAPQATNNTWYPYSFLAPVEQNEPGLSAALNVLKEIITDINKAGVPDDHIYFVGFSQGACLTLEFTSRNARKWGGIVAFTGGLIGEKVRTENYTGDFGQTPVFIATGNPDPHVPVERVQATAAILKEMNADVLMKVYANRGHLISEDEIELANKFVFK